MKILRSPTQPATLYLGRVYRDYPALVKGKIITKRRRAWGLWRREPGDTAQRFATCRDLRSALEPMKRLGYTICPAPPAGTFEGV